MNGHPCVIIADPDGRSWEFAKHVYAVVKDKVSNFELVPVKIKRFPDGEFKPVIQGNVRRRECYFIHDSSAKPTDWLAELALVNRTIRNSSADRIYDVLPYLKYSRQDRRDEARTPISTQLVADIIALDADGAITLDLHSPQTAAAYKSRVEFEPLYSFPRVIAHLKQEHPELLENLIVASTDAGGADRARAFARRAGTPLLAFGNKVREAGGGGVQSLELYSNTKNLDFHDHNVMFVDDIGSTGGTLIMAADAARRYGAKKVFGYVAHGLWTDGVKKVAKAFDILFVGDTIVQKSPLLEVISHVPLFGEAIYRVSEGKSLSELFK